MSGRKRSRKSSGGSGPQSASASAIQVSAAAPPAIVRRFPNFLSGRTDTITLSPKEGEQRALVAQALGVIMSDHYFVWSVHSFAYCKALHMLLGSPCTSYAFLRHEPDIDLDGIGFTRHDLFDGLDQTMLLQRDARGRFKRTCGGGKHVSNASSAAAEGKHVCTASCAALASVGGSSMVSWLVRALLTGKNFPRDVQGHIHQPTSARGCKEVFERRLWGMQKRIKVFF